MLEEFFYCLFEPNEPKLIQIEQKTFPKLGIKTQGGKIRQLMKLKLVPK